MARAWLALALVVVGLFLVACYVLPAAFTALAAPAQFEAYFPAFVWLAIGLTALWWSVSGHRLDD